MLLNQDPNSALFATIAGAGDGNEYADRFLDGEHIVALNTFELKQTQDHGRIFSVDFLVIESIVPGYAGKTAGEGYFIDKSDKDGGSGARQRTFGLAKAAIQSLGGDPEDKTPILDGNGQIVMIAPNQPLTKGFQLVQQTLAEMSSGNQPWRGLMLRASGRKKTGKKSNKEYVTVKYAPLTQTAEQIHAARSRIEAAMPLTPAVAPPAYQLAPAPVAPAVAAPVQYQAMPSQAAPVQYQTAPAPAAPVGPAFGGGSLLGR